MQTLEKGIAGALLIIILFGRIKISEEQTIYDTTTMTTSTTPTTTVTTPTTTDTTTVTTSTTPTTTVTTSTTLTTTTVTTPTTTVTTPTTPTTTVTTPTTTDTTTVTTSTTPTTTTLTTPTTTVTTPTTPTTTVTTSTSPTTTVTTSTTPTTTTVTTPTTTVTPPTVTTTIPPPQPGEVQVTVALTCSFSNTFVEDYKDTKSQKYNDFTTNIIDNMAAEFKKGRILRLIRIIFKSLSPGSVIADMELITATVESEAANNSAIISVVTTTTTRAFVNSTIISATVTNKTKITPQALQKGEIPITIRLICSFNDQYDTNYNNVSSSPYIAYTDKIFNKMVLAFIRNGLMRLYQIVYNSLVSGSVIADMILISATYSTSVNETQVLSAMTLIMKDAFNGSATINSINVNILPMITDRKDGLEVWQIALIALFSVIIFVGIIICIIAIISSVRSKNRKESRYLDIRAPTDPRQRGVDREWRGD